MLTVDIAGIATHYEISGSGPPIFRYLEECIPGSEYWDVHLESQPPDLIRDRILAFLAVHARAGVH